MFSNLYLLEISVKHRSELHKQTQEMDPFMAHTTANAVDRDWLFKRLSLKEILSSPIDP